jgi:hypothetical protein
MLDMASINVISFRKVWQHLLTQCYHSQNCFNPIHIFTNIFPQDQFLYHFINILMSEVNLCIYLAYLMPLSRVQIIYCWIIGWTENKDRNGCERKWPWPDLMYYPGIWLEGLGKNLKNLSQDNSSHSRHFPNIQQGC